MKRVAPKGPVRDDEDLVSRLGAETGLTRDEASYYLKILRQGSVPASPKDELAEGLTHRGMTILSGDGQRIIPVHPRLGVANQYRTWRESMVREINDRRMRTDRLILELIPFYEAATEKRTDEGGE
ncbi:MAG: hypothetical protein OK438_02620 [Thaumarchaeota archaeon]|nr:hypothetical protein [Nitrososphaerota archaeon]